VGGNPLSQIGIVFLLFKKKKKKVTFGARPTQFGARISEENETQLFDKNRGPIFWKLESQPLRQKSAPEESGSALELLHRRSQRAVTGSFGARYPSFGARIVPPLYIFPNPFFLPHLPQVELLCPTQSRNRKSPPHLHLLPFS